QYIASANPGTVPRTARVRVTPPAPMLPEVMYSRGLMAIFDGKYNYARDDSWLDGNPAYPVFDGTSPVSLNAEPAVRDVDDFAIAFVFEHEDPDGTHRLTGYNDSGHDSGVWINQDNRPVL